MCHFERLKCTTLLSAAKFFLYICYNKNNVKLNICFRWLFKCHSLKVTNTFLHQQNLYFFSEQSNHEGHQTFPVVAYEAQTMMRNLLSFLLKLLQMPSDHGNWTFFFFSLPFSCFVLTFFILYYRTSELHLLYCYYIHLLLVIKFKVTGELGPIPAVTGAQAVYILDRSPACNRANTYYLF